MYFSKQEFETALNGINKRIEKITNEINKTGNSRLVCRTKGNRTYYSERYGTQELGISRNKNRIYALIKSEYLKHQLNALQQNRQLIEACKNNYCELESDSILSALSRKYKNIPIEDILLCSYDDWGKHPYEKNPYYKENLKYITSNSLRVRSKSEREIANELEELSISFRYDALIDCYDVTHYADFLIKRPDGSLLIWEHFGREHDRQYMAKNRERIKDYISIGYRPWDNLVWTLESDLEDPSAIRHIIRRFILCDINK